MLRRKNARRTKARDKVAVTGWVPRELRDRIRRRAKANGRSEAAEVRYLLEVAVQTLTDRAVAHVNGRYGRSAKTPAPADVPESGAADKAGSLMG